jgi:hypothetical protein
MTDKSGINRGALISFYDGAYGPTIRIEAHSVEIIEQIRSIFLELASAGTREVELHKVEGVRTEGVKEFVLKFVPGEGEPRRTLKLVHTGSEGSVFCWSKSSEGWVECAELLDGILHQHPGHQYLTDEAIDDALVVVAFMEA